MNDSVELCRRTPDAFTYPHAISTGSTFRCPPPRTARAGRRVLLPSVVVVLLGLTGWWTGDHVRQPHHDRAGSLVSLQP